MQITLTLPPEFLEAIQNNTAAVEKLVATLDSQAVLPKELPSNPKKETTKKENEKRRDIKDEKYTGADCGKCGAPQFETPSGVTCKNGHGGASEKELAEEVQSSTYTLDFVTTKTREFIQSNPENRKKLKDFLDSKKVKKVSDLAESDYDDVISFFGDAS